MISVEVRSSGWGPRARRFVNGRVIADWLGVEPWRDAAVASVTTLWPRDGVAIIVRRES